MNTGNIVLRRLFDQHAISISTKSKLASNFKVFATSDKFFSEFQFMEPEQERHLRRKLYNSEEHTFVVKYHVKELGG